MDPTIAPGTTWEVRLRWGSRRLAAELLGVDRTRLVLGNEPGDDVDTGSPVRLKFELTPEGLVVDFSLGVTGTASLRGDQAVTVGQLVERGAVSELMPGTWRLTLGDKDHAKLVVGMLVVDVRRAQGRIRRLGFDPRVLVLVGVALLAIAIMVASIAAPTPTPHLPMRPVKPKAANPPP
jgi:hypothetical protein